ncbi:MAG TPA: hypothetical protein IGS52_15855 [Oscillatoriaceae cyanobacterium M33_DOE_052]|uniref:Uncharacterized protein n=1 Tax=Planktothricoides sp. SpSt-374 TaxID=2282167 RepID=A0A7C3ZKP9_9CYAN|nr:hypothetical protein [Oscillatoriaceae cyanobacterium M33_DOE_052]
MKTAKTSHWQRLFSYFAIFFGAFAGTTFGIRLILPPPEIPVVTPKLTTFAATKQNYNAIFIGSSRTYRHIIPSIFDAELQRRGYNITSYNFGIYAMQLPETYFLLQQILAMKPPGLQYVFIDIDSVNLDIPKENRRTDRVISWHGWQQMPEIYQLIGKQNQNWRKKQNLMQLHATPFFSNIGNLGQADRLFALLAPATTKSLNPGYDTAYKEPGADGYLSLDNEDDIIFTKQRQEYLAKLDDYHAQVATLAGQEQTQKTRRLQPYEADIIQKLVKAVTDAGATPIFFIHPVLKQEAHLIEAHQKGYIPILFPFNQPDKFPNLYEPENRYDWYHLNHKGAEEFTQLLADEFARYCHLSLVTCPLSPDK